jgi:hypothetical protein
MAPTITPTMTVLHLESGHVLAAAASGSRTVTVADLTGGTYLAVRLPGSRGAAVNVPAELLTAATVPLDDDVLSRPLEYLVGTGVPALTFGGRPINLGPTSAKIDAPDGTAVTSLWRVGDELEVAHSTLDGGRPEGGRPTGASHRLVACRGEPLAYER